MDDQIQIQIKIQIYFFYKFDKLFCEAANIVMVLDIIAKFLYDNYN